MLPNEKQEDAAIVTKMNECEYCGKSFAHRYSLIRHLKSHSSDCTFHECDACGRKFKRRDLLTRHMTQHTGSSNFECANCKKSFFQKSNLKRHLMKKKFCKAYSNTFTTKMCASDHNLYAAKEDLCVSTDANEDEKWVKIKFSVYKEMVKKIELMEEENVRLKSTLKKREEALWNIFTEAKDQFTMVYATGTHFMSED